MGGGGVPNIHKNIQIEIHLHDCFNGQISRKEIENKSTKSPQRERERGGEKERERETETERETERERERDVGRNGTREKDGDRSAN